MQGDYDFYIMQNGKPAFKADKNPHIAHNELYCQRKVDKIVDFVDWKSFRGKT